jgi:hypothetical protein
MSQISPKAVILGGITDIVATNLTGIPVAVFALVQTGAYALPKAEQTKTVMDALQNVPSLYVTQMLLGSLCSILGGYIAARIAKRGAVLNGALSAFLCVGSGLYSLLTAPSSMSPWAHAGFFILSPALGAAGGYLWQRRRSTTPRVTAAAA